MHRKTVRIACLVVALLATAGLGYRAFQNETALTNERLATAEVEQAAGRTAELLLDLRASLHAYVAQGQNLPFWGKRAQEGIQALRGRLASLDARVAPAGGALSLKPSLDSVAQLEAAERRARTYVSRDEMLLAGDVIFTEVRDLLAAMTRQVEAIRGGLPSDRDRRAAGIRREQLMLAGGTLAIWIILALLFLPVEPKPVQHEPATIHITKDAQLSAAPSAEIPAIAEPTLVSEPAQPAIDIHTLRRIAEICSDLSALTDPGALQGALERVNGVLNATGLIVWIASNDGSSLSPVATHGFDPRIVSRIGRIGRDGVNLTAGAFRDNAPKVSAPTPTAPGALAVPMCGPTGTAGVFSVELKTGQAVEDAHVVLAAIVAAQLATLTMPIADQRADLPAAGRESTAQSA